MSSFDNEIPSGNLHKFDFTGPDLVFRLKSIAQIRDFIHNFILCSSKNKDNAKDILSE